MREEGSRPVFVVPRRIIPALYKAVAHTRLPAPTSAGGRNGHAAAPGKGPPSLAASDEPAAVQAPPDAPAQPPGEARAGLKTSPTPAPPDPTPDTRGKRKARAHTTALPLLAAKATIATCTRMAKERFPPESLASPPRLGIAPGARTTGPHSQATDIPPHFVDEGPTRDRVRPLPLP